ncbi:hypothetical protein DBR06_SOUSAS8310133 [Sousa chinensis]|nr:hypothetical protein DBR06_SOUSAS8310133 [Sousa chinensis]
MASPGSIENEIPSIYTSYSPHEKRPQKAEQDSANRLPAPRAAPLTGLQEVGPPLPSHGRGWSQNPHLSSDESCYKKPLRDLQGHNSPARHWAGGPVFRAVWFSAAATMCSQRALGARSGPGRIHLHPRESQNKPFSLKL